MKQREITGKMIIRVVTCFKYKEDSVVFEIFIRLVREEDTVLVLTTVNYELFKKSYDKLNIIKKENIVITLPQRGFNENWLESAA